MPTCLAGNRSINKTPPSLKKGKNKKVREKRTA